MTDLYDLFGGGGAVSYAAMANYQFGVHYNELNGHIYSLVEHLKAHHDLDPKFYQWVTRDEFFRQGNRTDADWYSGFVMSCWSFGNDQTSYLYGRDIEETKRLAHEFVVNSDLSAMDKLDINIPSLLNINDVQKRTIIFCDHISKKQGRFDLQHLQRLQRLQHLETTNLSYENVIITGENTVIYCDIPYRKTKQYKEGGFDHDKFYTWASECQHPVYISEYDAPFELVHAFKHRSSLSATNNNKQTIEGLFWNGKGNPAKTNLFS